MRLGKTYWVRLHTTTLEFPQVFFDSKKECADSMKALWNRKDYECVKVKVTALDAAMKQDEQA